MLSYVIESRERPLMVVASASRETIENFVKKFPKKVKASYREIRLEQAEEIERQITEELATILTDKY